MNHRPTVDLRRRREELKRELDEVTTRLEAIHGHKPALELPVPTRLRLFMQEYPSIAFSPRELAEAIEATDVTVRKALTYLTNCGFVIRVGHGVYGIDPVTGPLDWESARALRGWEDP